jgi:hypothetical protein
LQIVFIGVKDVISTSASALALGFYTLYAAIKYQKNF